MRSEVNQFVGNRRDWIPVAVSLNAESEVAMQILRLARARRWQLVSLSKFSNEVPDGLHLKGALVNLLSTDPLAKQLLQKQIPTIRLGALPNPDDSIMPAVMPDRLRVGRLAAEHFAERGFKNLAYMGRDPWSDGKPLYDSFAERAVELGCPVHLIRLPEKELRSRAAPGRDWWDIQREAFVNWITTLPKPVGILGFVDSAADRYCQWTVEAGFHVPEEIAILGSGNIEFACESAIVPLSSVAPDHELIARTAIEMLEQLMAGKQLEQTTVMIPPLGVVTRQSTDVLAVVDPFVAKAIRFMWDNISENLPVQQISDHVGISRRKLERAFNKSLGRGINQEFQRRRLEKARDMLMQTNIKIADVAQALKFSSHNYFCRSFRSAYGVSATKYRSRDKEKRAD